MTRKLIRPTISSLGPRAGQSRRRKTGEHGAFAYSGAPGTATGTLARVVLNDGEEVIGKIEWADRDCLKIRREATPSLIIMRHAVRCIFEIDSPGSAE